MSQPSPRAARQLVGALLFLLVLGACVTAGPGPGRPIEPPEAAVAPWEIPPEAYPTQRLYRLHVESAEGDGTLRLTFRLERPDRYRLAVADRLGRSLFTVAVDGRSGWLLDHRERRACRLTPGTTLRGVPLEPLAPRVLPAMLLGRVPAEPAGEVAERSDAVSFRDGEGHRWDVVQRQGTPVGWTRWVGGEPVAWWRRVDGEALLSERTRGVQMRWREIAVELLEEPLAPVEPPAGFDRGSCAVEEELPSGGI